MAKETKYAYDIELSYRSGGKETSIESAAIQMLMITYEYYTNNMPAIIMHINLPVLLYNKMVLNYKSSTIYMKISRMEKNAKNPITTKILESEFDYYFASDNLEYDTSLVKESGGRQNSAYRSTAIALLDNSLISYNKTFVNDVIKSATLSSLVVSYVARRPTIMEPLSNNVSISEKIIPPLDSVSKLLAYLDKAYSLYNSDYIFFMNFNETYLLSTNGNALTVADGNYDSVKIEVVANSTDNPTAYIQGIVKDTSKKIHIMQVNSNNIDMRIGKLVDKRVTQLGIVNTMGKFTKENLASKNRESDSTDKIKLFRANQSNNSYIRTLNAQLSNNDALLSISKADIDTTLFVPYKSFYIDNVSEFKEYNGRYAIVNKREVYVANDDKFYCSANFTFRKLANN